MKVSDRNYLNDRIQETVRCTNGEVSTRLQKRKRAVKISDQEKYRQIRDGVATLRPMEEIEADRGYDRNITGLLASYTYKLSARQEADKANNKTIDNKIESIHTEIELEGKRLLDNVVLGIISLADVPAELKRIGEMVSLAD